MTTDIDLVPDRYALEVRLGMDQDIEEWLATDLYLDRPVLVRLLTDVPPERSEQFLESVRGAAAVPHSHIVDIYEAGTHGPVTYSVSEWAGGMTLADRTAANEPVGNDEFLPNATGLASALAALHDADALHGAIDESAIYFSAAHPAKLAAFGRRPIARSKEEDTRMLAQTLERSLTGREAGSVAPSQVVLGVDSTVDTALTTAQSVEPDARILASSLRGAPTPGGARARGDGWSWRWLVPTTGLAVVAVALMVLLAALDNDTASGSSPPAPTRASTPAEADDAPSAPATPPSAATDTGDGAPPDATATSSVVTVTAEAFDPFGGDGEHDDLAARVIDGDFETEWKTESYYDPLPRLKPGVGIVVEVAGTVEGVQASGIRDGSQLSLYWAPEVVQDLEAWTLIATGTVRNGRFDTEVQLRRDGAWLLWFTDLPASNEGTFNTTVAEVRFRP